MPKQSAFPDLHDAMKKKVTRREQFLAEMEAVVPWGRLLALTAPHYPKATAVMRHPVLRGVSAPEPRSVGGGERPDGDPPRS